MAHKTYTKTNRKKQRQEEYREKLNIGRAIGTLKTIETKLTDHINTPETHPDALDKRLDQSQLTAIKILSENTWKKINKDLPDDKEMTVKGDPENPLAGLTKEQIDERIDRLLTPDNRAETRTTKPH